MKLILEFLTLISVWVRDHDRRTFVPYNRETGDNLESADRVKKEEIYNLNGDGSCEVFEVLNNDDIESVVAEITGEIVLSNQNCLTIDLVRRLIGGEEGVDRRFDKECFF